jgi:hypothetical protein
VTQSQVAATVAALLGEDWCASESKAGKPIADAIGPEAGRGHARDAGRVLFVVVAIAAFIGLHVYAWKRLVRDPELPRPWRRGATFLVVFLGFLVCAVFVSGRRVDPDT